MGIKFLSRKTAVFDYVLKSADAKCDGKTYVKAKRGATSCLDFWIKYCPVSKTFSL